MEIEYIVRCELDDLALRAAFEEWLTSGHARDVCEAGALRADVLRLDGQPPRVEVRYLFASREAFAAYERDHAPRLRREGRERFPTGVRMERVTARVLHRESSRRESE